MFAIPKLKELDFVYFLRELTRAGIMPSRVIAKNIHQYSSRNENIARDNFLYKQLLASSDLYERLTRQYEKPSFDITEVQIADKAVKIIQEVVLKETFCDLIHFKKATKIDLPKLLIVAPFSGHYATLCRGTVQGLLPFFDIYITDWKNVRDVPLAEGDFDLDDFISYCSKFFSYLGENLHVMAVCQPSVPVVVSSAIMATDNYKTVPKSMILVGGPIDTRVSPTEVNIFAEKKPLSWFKEKLISKVPINYKGYMREVYPGFIQIASFVSMNFTRHLGEQFKLYNNIISGNHHSEEVHKKFYDEYFAVMDLPAEFYLQTIDKVFKRHVLPKNEFIYKDRKIDMKAISKTALFVIEGELDDITGLGQTKAVMNLCSNISEKNKRYLMQKDVGHFGLFSGSKFKSLVIPEIIKFVNSIDAGKNNK